MKSTVKYWSEEKYSSVPMWDLHRPQGAWELWYQVCSPDLGACSTRPHTPQTCVYVMRSPTGVEAQIAAL